MSLFTHKISSGWPRWVFQQWKPALGSLLVFLLSRCQAFQITGQFSPRIWSACHWRCPSPCSLQSRASSMYPMMPEIPALERWIFEEDQALQRGHFCCVEAMWTPNWPPCLLPTSPHRHGDYSELWGKPLARASPSQSQFLSLPGVPV